jgi:hypothetical protein
MLFRKFAWRIRRKVEVPGTFRAVQISGLVDPAALIWLGERVLQRPRANQVGGEGLIERADSSGALPRKDLKEPQGAVQIPPLRSPGFTVENRGFDDLHAALSTESRTRGRR